MAETGSASGIDEGQAAAGTRGASVGSTGQAAGTAAGTTEAGAGAQGRLAQTEIVGDINLTDSYAVQLKRLVAMELTHDASIQSIERRLMNTAASASENLIQTASSAAQDLIKSGTNAVISDMQKTARSSLHEVDKLTNMGDELEKLVVAKLADLLGIKTPEAPTG